MPLTKRVSRISSSVTLELDARAKALAATGADVVSMAVGEPDFPAPALARAAAAEKIAGGEVRYTPAAGTPSLRAALAEHLAATRGGRWSRDEVTVCHSAKHALSGALLALVQEGDEVLVPLPAWSSYVDLVRIAGAQPVLVPCRPPEPQQAGGAESQGRGGEARPDLGALRAVAGPRARVVLLNSPNNPSGYVWTRAETEELAAIALERDLWIVSDEIYRALVHAGPPAESPASLGADVRARTAIVDGASKAFAMTGWRIGFLAAPPELAGAVARLHSQTTGSPNAISQEAWEAVLRREPPELADMLRAFAERRSLLLEGLRALQLPTPEPRGAYYAFPDVSRHLDGRGSVGFCEDLLEEQRLALVPGAAFGMDGHVRLSYACDLGRIREALVRLETFLRARQR